MKSSIKILLLLLIILSFRHANAAETTPKPIFASDFWNHFSVEKISDKKLRETMSTIFKYRQNAKNYILEAEKIRKNLPDKLTRNAIGAAIGAAFGAAISGDLTTIIIGAAIGAVSSIATTYYIESVEIIDLLELAKLESEKADLLEQHVLINASLSFS